jgi:hypothetical protein
MDSGRVPVRCDPAAHSQWIDLIADVELPWSLTPADWQARASQDGAFLVLSADDAAALLNEPKRWVLGTADGAMLCRTGEGQAHEYPEWLALAEETAQSRG